MEEDHQCLDQWKIPKCIKGELRWKNGWHWQDVFVEVPISTIVLYPKNQRNLVLKSIPFTQISEITQTNKVLNKCFKIHLKNGESFLFQCTDKSAQSVKKWVQSFTHAKNFWESKEILNQKRQRPRKVTSVQCEGGCIWIFFTLSNNELFVVLVNNSSTFHHVYPHLFGSCQHGACSTCKIRHQSCKLWAVDTSGTKRVVGKDEILTEYSRQGYMLYVLEHNQKLLILHYNDASYDVIPVSSKITAQEVLQQEAVATKLKELGCLNPGLFLKVENGKELLFHNNDQPFQYQHGKFVVKSKVIMRVKSKEKTKKETIAELRWKMYLQSYQTKKMDEYLNGAITDLKSFSNENSGLSFANDHFALVRDKDESKCYGKKDPKSFHENIPRDSLSRTDDIALNIENKLGGHSSAVKMEADLFETDCSADLMSERIEGNKYDENEQESYVESVTNSIELTKETAIKIQKESRGSSGKQIAGAEMILSIDKTKSNPLLEYRGIDKNNFNDKVNVFPAEISGGNKDNEKSSDTRCGVDNTLVCPGEAQTSNNISCHNILKENAPENNVNVLCRSISDTEVLKNTKYKKQHASKSPQFVTTNLYSISLPDLRYSCTSSSPNITTATSVPDLNKSDECLRVNDVFIANESSDDNDDDVLPSCQHHVTNGETSSSGLDWQVAKKVEKAVLGILAAQPGSEEVNELIFNLLYPALLEIFENGLKRSASFLLRIFSRVDVWDVCKAISLDSRIAKGLISDTENEAHTPTTKFLYFLRACINKSYLSKWFELLREMKVQERVIKYYEKDALVLKMINAASMEHMKVFLDKLDGLKLVKESSSGNTDHVNNLFIFE